VMGMRRFVGIAGATRGLGLVLSSDSSIEEG